MVQPQKPWNSCDRWISQVAESHKPQESKETSDLWNFDGWIQQVAVFHKPQENMKTSETSKVFIAECNK